MKKKVDYHNQIVTENLFRNNLFMPPNKGKIFAVYDDFMSLYKKTMDEIIEILDYCEKKCELGLLERLKGDINIKLKLALIDNIRISKKIISDITDHLLKILDAHDFNAEELIEIKNLYIPPIQSLALALKEITEKNKYINYSKLQEILLSIEEMHAYFLEKTDSNLLDYGNSIDNPTRVISHVSFPS